MTKNPWLWNVVLASGKPVDFGADFGGFSLKKLGRTVKGAGRTVRATAANLGHGKIGAAAKRAAQGTEQALNEITSNLHAIPSVGPALEFTFRYVNQAEIIKGVAQVVQGKAVNKAAYDGLKERIKITKEVAPFALAAVGAPPVGAGAEGAVASGNAISKGPLIGESTLRAATADLPPGAQKAFTQAYSAMVSDTPSADPMVNHAVSLTKEVMVGKKNGSQLDAIIAKASPEVKKGIQAGLSMGVAKVLQKATREGVKDSGENFLKIGMAQSEKNPIIKLAAQELRFEPYVQNGFYKAIGLLVHKANPAAIDAARESMTPEERKGFDIAASLRIGQLAKPQSQGTPREKLGFYLAKGSEGMSTENRKHVLKIASNNPLITQGVRKGLADKPQGFFRKILDFILGKDSVKRIA